MDFICHISAFLFLLFPSSSHMLFSKKQMERIGVPLKASSTEALRLRSRNNPEAQETDVSSRIPQGIPPCAFFRSSFLLLGASCSLLPRRLAPLFLYHRPIVIDQPCPRPEDAPILLVGEDYNAGGGGATIAIIAYRRRMHHQLSSISFPRPPAGFSCESAC